MVIGGDIVQSAFAQGTGKLYTPVCFSFGYVAYAINSLVSIIGEGRLLPRPDYPAKVFNLDSGYSRENKNWVIGRLLRDMETSLLRDKPIGSATGVRISVFNALPKEKEPTQFSWCFMHLVGAIATLFQLMIAAVPIARHRQWDIMLITVAGTILVQITGLLPQWTAEKLPNQQNSKAYYAVTTGNGSRNIVVIRGNGVCLNLEEMSASPSPRVNRPWEKFPWLSTPSMDLEGSGTGSPDTWRQEAKTLYGLPLGFRLTQINCAVQSVLWLVLLMNVAACKNTWYILWVGTLGMFQNAWLAAAAIPPEKRNIHIELHDTITRHKVMDGIMDFEVKYGRGLPLMEEFFPGPLRPEEVEWWRGRKGPYNKIREEKEEMRGRPSIRRVSFPTLTTMNSQRRRHSYPDPDDISQGTYRSNQLGRGEDPLTAWKG